MFFIWLVFFTWCEIRVSFDSISSVEWSWHLCQNHLTGDIQNGFIFGLSVLFHWSGYQFLCQHYTVLITLNFGELTSFFFLILFLNFTILYWFCQISKWICHRYTCVPHPEPSSLLLPHTIPLGHPSAPAPRIQYRASNLDWRLIPYMILYVFQCHSPKSSHPLPLPQSPKDCSIHQCLFCCVVYRGIVTIFLNSIYMH